MDPKQIKLKTASKLNEGDKKYIREHPTEFSDEDRTAWADALTLPENTPPDDPNPPSDPASDPPPDLPPPPPPADPTPPTQYAFKSEEEAREFVQKEMAKEKQAAIDAAQTPAEKKYVEDTWKPKNWNEAFKTGAEAAADIVEQRQAARAKVIEEHNKKVEAEWQALKTEHKLEDVSTEDGKRVHDAIIDIGVKFGKKNFKDAYEVYMMVPEDKGGGYKAAPGVAPTPTPSEAASILAKQKAEKMNAQKKVAAKVGGQNPGAATNTKGSGIIKPITYEDMKNKSTPKLIREALAS